MDAVPRIRGVNKGGIEDRVAIVEVEDDDVDSGVVLLTDTTVEEEGMGMGFDIDWLPLVLVVVGTGICTDSEAGKGKIWEDIPTVEGVDALMGGADMTAFHCCRERLDEDDDDDDERDGEVEGEWEGLIGVVDEGAAVDGVEVVEGTLGWGEGRRAGEAVPDDDDDDDADVDEGIEWAGKGARWGANE